MKITTKYEYQVGDKVMLYGVMFDKVTNKDGTYDLVADVDNELAKQLINDGLVKGL